MAQAAYQMQLVRVPIYMFSALQFGGPRLSLTVAILAKGMCFSDLRLKAFVYVAV
jgi:EamA domain-containing membrane protein RarD